MSLRLGLEHISTGDLLRQAIKDQTAEGKLAQPFVTQGKLVPDAVVNDMVAARFRRADRPAAFVLDGYPRTVQQARTLDQILKEQGLGLSAVVYLDVEDREIVTRLGARWNCPNCKATYNSVNKPPRRPGVCDECGTALVQREDDQEETIRKRLEVFHQANTDLLAYYQAQGLLRRVTGTGDIETIYAAIAQALDKVVGA